MTLSEAKFSALLYGLLKVLRAKARKYPAFARRLAEKDLTVQIRTFDASVARHFTFEKGKVASARGVHPRPDVTISVATAELGARFWFSEEAIVRPGEWFTNFARQKLMPLKEKMVFLQREEEGLPGVSVLFAPGHTPGHMAVSITSEGERLLYTGDTVLHPIHLDHPDWLPVYDILPESAAASKHRIFDLAASTKSCVLGQHFPPFPNLGHVVKKEIGWDWQPI